MITYQLKGDYITLVQLLKVLHWVEHGGEAQAVVSAGLVSYNGAVDYRKRLKVRVGDVVGFEGKQVKLIA
ncbi:RNA-binding S4 domain-containing protein [Parapedobacter indicus]|uniref:Ribosome-associated protein n=1 Tax=Parapedobacter indicus TaxID=1477437 RepID=A0A1I3CVY7_9SPHI|nr:RNA-binding S4 domain-containing protein [Parapedobacter indicus]PPL04422.1 ribosome-associated protein [Parapedobacter indicus]SFH78672.1 ribosome-associated protein [Parapedobacter indicus]